MACTLDNGIDIISVCELCEAIVGKSTNSTLKLYHAVLGATRIQHHVAVSRGLFLITFRDPSLKTCSQKLP